MVPRISVIGDIYVDVVASQLSSLPGWGEDRTVGVIKTILGGSAANTARHMKGINPNLQIALIGSIGNDANGASTVQTLRESGLEDWCETGPASIAPDEVTGSCIVLSGAADRAFVSCNGANGGLYPHKDPDAVKFMKGSSHIHVHGYYNCLGLQTNDFAEFLEDLKKEQPGTTLSLDTQFDAEMTWERENLDRLLRTIDVFLPNETEGREICKKLTGCTADTPCAVINTLRERYPNLSLIVVKSGATGCWVYDSVAQTTTAHPPPAVLEVVDTTGAGDAFNAGFLSTWVANKDWKKSIEVGNKSGGLCVTRLGACDPPLTDKDVL
eukprot:TRINITY_DN6856_c0_g1_i1.p2 TRINITY_DN6856_c0_g1~~TRINITY_DN6856_c0_g1_i1.p2  ORF type:complete len:326 (+),score=78.35 TRINITY_DN6856_c0_g1_i1:41-1018(+)